MRLRFTHPKRASSFARFAVPHFQASQTAPSSVVLSAMLRYTGLIGGHRHSMQRIMLRCDCLRTTQPRLVPFRYQMHRLRTITPWWDSPVNAANGIAFTLTQNTREYQECRNICDASISLTFQSFTVLQNAPRILYRCNIDPI